MATVPLVCTKDEQRSVVYFLWAEGLQGAEIHMNLCAQSGGSAVSWKGITIEGKCSRKARQM
jgi:hypothetical protein